MAVTKPNRNTNQQTNDQVNQQTNDQAFDTAPRPMGGVRSMAGRFSGAAPRKLTTEIVKAYTEAFRKSAGDRPEFKFHLFDAAVQNTALSAVIVSSRVDTGSGAMLVAAHAIILASSSDRIPARTLQFNNQQIEIPSTPGDCFNETFENKMLALVQSAYPGAEVKSAAASVLHSDVKPDDEPRVQRAWSYAAEAVGSTLDALTGGQLREVFTVGLFDRTDTVIARIESNSSVESAGIPVRSDLAVAVIGQSQGSTDVFSRKEEPLTILDAYVDLSYVEPEQPEYNQRPDNRHYTPVVYITKMSGELGCESLEFRLLALHSATILSTNMAWAAPFRPRIGRRIGNIAVRDLAGICYDLPELVGGEAGVKMDTTSNDFKDADFADLLIKNVKDEVFFHMHVEESGEMTWLDSVFYAAACRDPNAKQTIINAADRLTLGAFSRLWNPAHEIASDLDQRIPLGYFTDSASGIKRDLREIGYLELLNILGATDVLLVQDFDRMMQNKNIPMEVRYKRHLEMYDRVLEHNYELKGSALAIRLSSDFLVTLGDAFIECGFIVRPANLNQESMVTPRRGADRFSGQRAYNSQTAQRAFSHGSGNQQRQQGFGNNMRYNGRRV